MISEMHKTVFIHAGAFKDRLHHMPPGATFIYATGNLAYVCSYSEDARELRHLTQKLAKRKEIVLTQRRRPDLEMRDKTCAFEYLATKRSE